MNTVEDLVILLYEDSPNSRALANSGMSFRKKPQAFACVNHKIAELSGSGWIPACDPLHDSFKVSEKGFFEDYFEVHSPMRARMSFDV